VYGPQKGLRPQDLEKAEECLRNLAAVHCGSASRFWWRWPSAANGAGAGAAGGLGFGLMAFLGAKAERGFNMFSRFAKLEKLLRTSDLIITGEGCIDQSTFMGKGVGEIAWYCLEKNIPCIAFAGDIAARDKATRFFTRAHALVDVTTNAKAQAEPAFWLERLAKQTASRFNL
jgi:glycerate kinase